MHPLFIFIIGIAIVGFLIHREGKRQNLHRQALERKRDIEAQLLVKELEDECDHLASQLTGSSDIRDDINDNKGETNE